MNVGPQQQAVVDPVVATGRQGPDVRRLQHRADPVTGHRAPRD